MCPVCRQPMVGFEFEGVEIDRCLECGGTWLDAGELEMLTDRAGVPSGELGAALQGTAAGRRTGRRCPCCPRKLREIRIGPEPSVVVDRCPWGQGLWFDKGEVKAVIRWFATGQEGVVARFFAEFQSGGRPSIETGD